MVVAWVVDQNDDVWAHVASMEEFQHLKWLNVDEVLAKNIICNFKKSTLFSQIEGIYIPMDLESIRNIFKLSKKGILISERKPYYEDFTKFFHGEKIIITCFGFCNWPLQLHISQKGHMRLMTNEWLNPCRSTHLVAKDI